MITGGATSSAMISSGRRLFSIERENASQLVDRLYFLVGHQDVRIVENDLHPLDIRHHVMRKIASLESHAFDHFQRRLDGRSELDRDDAMVAGALEGFRDDPAELSVIGRDAGDGPKALSAIEAPGRALERLDSLVDSQFKSLDQFHGIGALGKQRKPVLHEEIGEHGGGGGSVPRDFIGLLGDFSENLSAHILEWAFELDLAGDADAVTRDDWCADRAVHHRVHALWDQACR